MIDLLANSVPLEVTGWQLVWPSQPELGTGDMAYGSVFRTLEGARLGAADLGEPVYCWRVSISDPQWRVDPNCPHCGDIWYRVGDPKGILVEREF